MEKLIGHFRKLVEETPTEFFRYVFAQINWDNRMVGLTGPRGVGKTGISNFYRTKSYATFVECKCTFDRFNGENSAQVLT